MFTITRALEKTLRQHFIYQKLEIAYAIHKPFPFLEGLRDNSFITETMYRESMEAYRSQVPVPRLVYNILSHLEKMFNLSFLPMLFSRINLREYPDLTRILKSFRSVVISYGGWNRAGLTLLEVPANSAEGSSLQTLLPLPPPQHRSQSLSPREPSVSEPSASTQHSTEIQTESSGPPGPAVALPRATQEGRITPDDNLTSCINAEEDSQEGPGTPPASVQEIRDVSPEPNDPKEFQGASITLPNKKGQEKKKKYLVNSKEETPEKKPLKSLTLDHAAPRFFDTLHFSPWRQLGKLGSLLIHKQVLGNLEKADEKKRNNDVSSSSTRRCQKNIPPKGSGDIGIPPPRREFIIEVEQRLLELINQRKKPEDDPVDFHSPKLPVTCGEAKGILYKERLKRGSSEKCIQNEEGIWFTPKEFEIEGKRATSRKWKQSVHCRGKTLEELLKERTFVLSPKNKCQEKGK
ncbi:sp110 nuclear body protein [Prionailurus iriomotensis]